MLDRNIAKAGGRQLVLAEAPIAPTGAD